MPRTVEEILAHADELAERFLKYEPSSGDELNVETMNQLRAAVAEQSTVERHLLDTIRDARQAGMSWNAIGTTGEAKTLTIGKTGCLTDWRGVKPNCQQLDKTCCKVPFGSERVIESSVRKNPANSELRPSVSHRV